MSIDHETRIALAHARSTKLTVDALVKGLAEPTDSLVEEEDQRTARKAGWIAAAKGGLYVGIGIAVTAGTYTMGLPMFLIGWGPVIFGGITMFKGLSRAMLG